MIVTTHSAHSRQENLGQVSKTLPPAVQSAYRDALGTLDKVRASWPATIKVYAWDDAFQIIKQVQFLGEQLNSVISSVISSKKLHLPTLYNELPKYMVSARDNETIVRYYRILKENRGQIAVELPDLRSDMIAIMRNTLINYESAINLIAGEPELPRTLMNYGVAYDKAAKNVLNVVKQVPATAAEVIEQAAKAATLLPSIAATLPWLLLGGGLLWVGLYARKAYRAAT